ncbi:MAG TPA: hypothetical protein ENG16_01460 [Archaeoglobus sp.]|nr:hypothetical protein [Archaeoglobus sp.]
MIEKLKEKFCRLFGHSVEERQVGAYFYGVCKRCKRTLYRRLPTAKERRRKWDFWIN